MNSVNLQLQGLATTNELIIDHLISINSISGKILHELIQLSPFGQGNPAPIFASRNLEVNSISPLGASQKHTQITVQDIEGNTNTLIAWNSEIQQIPYEHIDFAYFIHPDEYQGKNSFYLEYIDHQEYIPDAVTLKTSPFPYKFEDHRHDKDQLFLTKNLFFKKEDVQIWYEGLEKPASLGVCSRTQLQKKEILVILSAPQSHSVLKEVIERSIPKTIYFFNLKNDQDNIKAFLSGLGGFIKYHLKNPSVEISLFSLSIHLGQTEETIFNGLSWFKERGNIGFVCDSRGKLLISKGTGIHSDEISKVEINLNKSLKETSAFRKYYKRVDLTQLLKKIEV